MNARLIQDNNPATSTTHKAGNTGGHVDVDLTTGEMRYVVDYVDHELDPLPAEAATVAADALTAAGVAPDDIADGMTAAVALATTPDAPCHVCDGEGFTDSNEDLSERAPWSFWEALKPPSDLAVRLGMVWRVACYACTLAPTTPVEG